ncbi:low temperature requirement protein A [Dermatobacter hominis]|uniref:low temperature requirement protein A n=1 Tax=Dermatobacter hominis TaxID=2884263 RepID=UPI001D1083C0|nr:low temperature requirement protein A [Dermatobacter hominis]UDY37584.1 low temperature requirement protein A [Dermatobacter hominis]
MDDDAAEVVPGEQGGAIELRDRESVVPIELFFDLVFVLGFTQCTASMVANPGWAGVGHALLVLATLWWAWELFAWVTSVVEPEEGWVRMAMLGATVALLIVAISIPEAFGERAADFAVAYAVVRLVHIGLYVSAARRRAGIRRAVGRFAISTVLVIALLGASTFTTGAAQVALWLAAIAVDGFAVLLGDPSWPILPSHFAERHNLVIIIALGESIVAIGTGVTVALSAPVVVGACLGATVAAALWWMYFDVVSLVTEQRLQKAPEGRDRTKLARDSYSFLHFPMIAGIVLLAFGMEGVLAEIEEPLDLVHVVALYGGASLYLLAHVALRLRNARSVNVERLVAAVLLVGMVAVGVRVDALVAIILLNVVVWAVIAYEAVFVYDERRYRLRHGMEEAEIGSSPVADAPVES